MKNKVGRIGHVISLHVISPATVVKVSRSGKTLWIKYNAIVPFDIHQKDESSEIIKCGSLTMLMYNNDYYDDDCSDVFMWLKYKDKRLMVFRNEYIDIKPECEKFWKDEHSWRNEFNERFYFGEWCYAEL